MAKHYKKYWYKVYLAIYNDYDDDGAYNPTSVNKLLYETHSLNNVLEFMYAHRYMEDDNRCLWYERLDRK